MKRKNFRLDKTCLDWLDTFDGRRHEHGKAEMVRCGITIATALESISSAAFLCELSRMIRNGQTDEALDALHNRLMDEAGGGTSAGGRSVVLDDPPPSDGGDVGDNSDELGGDLPPLPRVESNEGVEGTPETSEQAPEGDTESEGGPDNGEENRDSDGGGLLSKGPLTRAIGWHE